MSRFLIYGAGAIGSIIGAYLTRSSYSVALIGRESHINHISRAGLKIITKEGEFTVHPNNVVTHASQIEYQPGDVIFLTTKSQDTEEAAASLIQCVPENTPFFCLQNGISNEGIVSQRFRKVYGGVLYFSGTYLRPGEVSYTRPGMLGIGLYPSGIDDTAMAVCEAIRNSGIGAFTSEHIMALKWGKLVFNLGMAVNAAAGFSGEEVQAHRDLREFIADITEEGLKVIHAAGITLEGEPGQPPITERPARLRAMKDSTPPPQPEEMKHRFSVWQDLALGRGKSEIEFLNGEIVKLGKKLGVPTPLNSLMVRLVKQMARDKTPPGTYTIAQLREMA